jgi:hypothetical protein
VSIGINYDDEDQRNSIELQAIELSGPRWSGYNLSCVYIYVIISFRLPTWEGKGSVGML